MPYGAKALTIPLSLGLPKQIMLFYQTRTVVHVVCVARRYLFARGDTQPLVVPWIYIYICLPTTCTTSSLKGYLADPWQIRVFRQQRKGYG